MEKVNWNIKNQLKDVEISKVDSIVSQILNESTTQSKLCCNIAKQNYLESYSANPKPLEVDVLPMFSSETYAVICARLSLVSVKNKVNCTSVEDGSAKIIGNTVTNIPAEFFRWKVCTHLIYSSGTNYSQSKMVQLFKYLDIINNSL